MAPFGQRPPLADALISQTVGPIASPFGHLVSLTCLLWQEEASRALPLAPSPIPAPQIVTFWQKQAFGKLTPTSAVRNAAKNWTILFLFGPFS